MIGALPGQRQLYASPASRYCMGLLALLLLAQLAVAGYAWLLSNRILLPELERKAEVVAATLAADLGGALAHGAQPGDGMTHYLDAILRDNPDVAFIVLTGANGQVLHRSGQGGEIMEPERYLRRSTDIVYRYITRGRVEVGVDRHYVKARTGQLPLLLGAILAASLVIALELLRCTVTLHVIAPLRQALGLTRHMAAGDFRYRAKGARPQQLVSALNQIADNVNRAFGDLARLAATPQRRAMAEPVVRRLRSAYRFAEHGISRDLPQPRVAAVRLLGFLPVFAEMLGRMVLPLHAAQLAGAPDAVPRLMLMALPAGAFLLGAALMLPVAAVHGVHAGRRTTYAAGALVAAGALACGGIATGVTGFLCARALAGAGCALMFAACHGHVGDTSTPAERPWGMVGLFGAMLTADLCAPAVGALIAGHAGTLAVALAAAACALGAALAGALLLDNSTAQPRVSLLPALRQPCPGNIPQAVLGTLSVAPATLIYAAFPLVLAPLMLAERGSAGVGGALLLASHAAPAALLLPLAARLGQRYAGWAWIACIGGIVTGASALIPGQAGGAAMVPAALAVMGIGHAIGIPAQLVLAGRFAQAARQPDAPMLGGMCGQAAFAGGAAGALIAGLLGARHGPVQALQWLGLASMVASLSCALALHRLGSGADEPVD